MPRYGLQKGFTLVELIMVIVLLGIISVIPVSFIRYSVQGALDTANRQRLAMAAGVISEQLSRDLRAALPGSVRLNAQENCLEFIPALASTVYQDAPIDSPGGSFSALALPNTTVTGHVVIYPYATTTDNLYSPATPGVISPMTATLPIGTNTVTFDDSRTHQFQTDSPQRRVFIVDTPVTYCQDGGFVYRYSDYGFEATIGTGIREVIGFPLAPDTLRFSETPPSLRRNGLVTFQFWLQSQQSEERINVIQEVQLRNVP